MRPESFSFFLNPQLDEETKGTRTSSFSKRLSEQTFLNRRILMNGYEQDLNVRDAIVDQDQELISPHTWLMKSYGPFDGNRGASWEFDAAASFRLLFPQDE